MEVLVVEVVVLVVEVVVLVVLPVVEVLLVEGFIPFFSPIRGTLI